MRACPTTDALQSFRMQAFAVDAQNPGGEFCAPTQFPAFFDTPTVVRGSPDPALPPTAGLPRVAAFHPAPSALPLALRRFPFLPHLAVVVDRHQFTAIDRAHAERAELAAALLVTR